MVVGAQKVPFQAVFGPQPPGGGLGAVGVVVVGADAQAPLASLTCPATGQLFELVIPGGKLQAPVASRTCWANWQGEVETEVLVVGVSQENPFQP